jgi:cell division protein FtsA
MDRIITVIDVGTSKIYVAVCKSDSLGSGEIVGWGGAPSRGVRKGEIVDPAAASCSVRDAIKDAEEKAGLKIQRVFLAVTGSHIDGFNSVGRVDLQKNRPFTDEDSTDVLINARDVELPPQNLFLHSIIQRYRVDGKGGISNPIGISGRKLEVDLHLVRAHSNRIKQPIRCVKETGLAIEDVIFSGLASAHLMVNADQKKKGALVLDIGGGTTDFVLYYGGVVQKCGSLPIGGDHITYDLSQELNISMRDAERLKIDSNYALQAERLAPREIQIPAKDKSRHRLADRGVLGQIIRRRMERIFEAIARTLWGPEELPVPTAGVFLTGGSSLLRGIDKVAEEVFALPVHLRAGGGGDFTEAIALNPGATVALGVIHYATSSVAPFSTSSTASLNEKLRFAHYPW